jgi:hypothetical protein
MCFPRRIETVSLKRQKELLCFFLHRAPPGKDRDGLKKLHCQFFERILSMAITLPRSFSSRAVLVDKERSNRYSRLLSRFRSSYSLSWSNHVSRLAQGLTCGPPLAVPKNQGIFGVPYWASFPRSFTSRVLLPNRKAHLLSYPPVTL